MNRLLGPWPVQPLVARADLPRSDLDRIRRTMFELNDDAEAVSAMKGAALVRFVPTGPDHYGIVREAMQCVG